MYRVPALRTRIPRTGALNAPTTNPHPRLATRTVRPFSTTPAHCEILDISSLPQRVIPKYEEKPNTHLLSLNWPRPPQNVLLIPKHRAPHVKQSAVAFAKYLHANYPNLNLIFEPDVAAELHAALSFPVYSSSRMTTALPSKVDIPVQPARGCPANSGVQHGDAGVPRRVEVRGVQARVEGGLHVRQQRSR
ncbi:hypothetical protein VUR80DRAFT_612 [Thermomyces stellatus]